MGGFFAPSTSPPLFGAVSTPNSQRPTSNAQRPTSNIQHPTSNREQPKYDLDERLLEYSASVIRLVEDMAKTKAGNHVGGQLLRSGTSPYFNHGEAEAAESPQDFVYKMGVKCWAFVSIMIR